MAEIKVSFWKKVGNRLNCWLTTHDWKVSNTFFYPVNRYPYIDKLWESLIICEHCGLRIEPKFFNKNWRVKHQLAIFEGDDIKLNLNPKEASHYNFTVRIVKLLNKRQGMIK